MTGNRPNWPGIMFCMLLFALMARLPANAQQVKPAPLVPDTIAPLPAPVQPLPFSHKTHLASGMTCTICHINPDPGTAMTFPVTATCMSCHLVIANNKPAIIRLHEYSDSDEKIPWIRVYQITAGVNWSHRVHLDAGMQCEACHGDLSQTEGVAKTKAIEAMAVCISCHQEHQAPVECVSCHAWPTDQDLGFE